VTLAVRFTGRLDALAPSDRRAIVERARAEVDERVEQGVRAILGRVRREGDAAVLELTRTFDKAAIDRLEVPLSACESALARLDVGVRRGLERAAKNLATVHRAFLPGAVEVESEPGVVVGRRPDPLAAVGVYAPGGRAAYPSSVLMGVVPARVAGVAEIVVASPPGPSGLPSDVVLAAAAIGGATRVFAMGGAQAIGALAYGTASVPKVDRIVGPGNAWVAEAKRQVAGTVGIDAPAGPSEILVIADESADPAAIARELCAQAEHDPEASCVALVLGDPAPVERALAAMEPPKRALVAQALSTAGAILEVRSFDEAVAFAADYGAEHLLLAVRDPEALLPRIRHAGTIFLGDGSSVAFGDYLTGGNHVLPTAGAGRSFSGLSTLDFVRFTTYQRVTRAAAARMAGDVGLLADAEGLPSHAAAARAYAHEDPR
jgi:histidinol dehydrogenase